MLAEYVVLPATALVAVPDHLTSVEAATLPCAGVTAWHGLIARGGMGKGDTLLVQGTGGVALFGLQFAAALGARAIVISSSNENSPVPRRWVARSSSTTATRLTGMSR